MIYAYRHVGGRLVRLGPEEPPDGALWIDLYRPMPAEAEAVAALGHEVPTLAEMEEIEISNRLYREGEAEVITVMLPGLSESKAPLSGPVSFIISPGRLVTVRHHAPRPFETYPDRADKTGTGCRTPERVFLGLVEEIVGRLADLLEGTGRTLDDISRSVFHATGQPKTAAMLQDALERVGREGDLIGRVRLSLLTLGRGISFFGQGAAGRATSDGLKAVVKALQRDIQALEVHADFLSSRVALATDATLGMINLAQNMTVRIVSVVAVLFLPPTLIASIYGMNFRVMPELERAWGYPAALVLMVASALLTYLFFKWKNWL